MSELLSSPAQLLLGLVSFLLLACCEFHLFHSSIEVRLREAPGSLHHLTLQMIRCTYPKRKLNDIEERNPELMVMQMSPMVLCVWRAFGHTSTGTKFWAMVIDNGETIHEIWRNVCSAIAASESGVDLLTRTTERKPAFTVLRTSSLVFAPLMTAIEARYAGRAIL